MNSQENIGKREIEKNRNINWKGIWTRVDVIAEELKNTSPSSFRHCQVKGRNGEIKSFWAFTKVVRLKKYGKKRLVIAHETEDLSDTPRFLLTDALHWEITRIIQTWNYRWSVEVFHEASQTNNWIGVFSGTQGGSGKTPLSFELCSAVVASKGCLCWSEIGKI